MRRKFIDRRAGSRYHSGSRVTEWHKSAGNDLSGDRLTRSIENCFIAPGIRGSDLEDDVIRQGCALAVDHDLPRRNSAARVWTYCVSRADVSVSRPNDVLPRLPAQRCRARVRGRTRSLPRAVSERMPRRASRRFARSNGPSEHRRASRKVEGRGLLLSADVGAGITRSTQRSLSCGEVGAGSFDGASTPQCRRRSP